MIAPSRGIDRAISQVALAVLHSAIRGLFPMCARKSQFRGTSGSPDSSRARSLVWLRILQQCSALPIVQVDQLRQALDFPSRATQNEFLLTGHQRLPLHSPARRPACADAEPLRGSPGGAPGAGASRRLVCCATIRAATSSVTSGPIT